jgi:hypothetical protein
MSILTFFFYGFVFPHNLIVVPCVHPDEVGTVIEESNDYFVTRYWTLVKSNGYFATRYRALKTSGDYFAARYWAPIKVTIISPFVAGP